MTRSGFGKSSSANSALTRRVNRPAPFARTMPNSRRCPRISLIRAVRVFIHAVRAQCRAAIACIASDLIGTGLIA